MSSIMCINSWCLRLAIGLARLLPAMYRLSSQRGLPRGVAAPSAGHSPSLLRAGSLSGMWSAGRSGREVGWSFFGPLHRWNRCDPIRIHDSQLSTLSPGTAARSESDETTVQSPRDFAIAAIMISITCMGRPARRRPARNRPNSAAAFLSNGQIVNPEIARSSRPRFLSRVELNSMP